MIVSGQTTTDLIRRGSAQTLSLTIYSSTLATLTVTSGTFSLYNPDGDVIVNAGAVTVSSATASYALGATVLDNSAYGGNWREEWTLLLSDGSTQTFIRPATVCRIPISGTLIPAHLSAVKSSLPGVGTFTFDGEETTWLAYAWGHIENCYDEMLRSIEQNGILPSNIVSLSLFDYHRALTLVEIFEDLATAGDDFDRAATTWAAKLAMIKAGATLRYDLDGDGVIDTTIRGIGGFRGLDMSTPFPHGVV